MKVNIHKVVSKHVKKVSGVLLTVMIAELLIPLKAVALTAGPSQPEFQGFTPLATSSLVDHFSGDFSYNIPLLEIDGYPLNLVYRATSNIEEEGSWVGYGWNVNVGTLNRLVRGLPDDMNGGTIKNYQNIRKRTVESVAASFEPNFGVHAGSDGVGLEAGVQMSMGSSYDEDNYTGVGIGVTIGGGVYAAVNAGPFSVGANAGVTLAAHSSAGGTITPYAGWNAGISYGDYVSVGFGKSVSRTFNTITGWEKPNIVGSLNISNVTMEIQKSFVNSVSNEIPQITNRYLYTANGIGFRMNAGVSIGLIEQLGFDISTAVSLVFNETSTEYNNKNEHHGYGYMYSENATTNDLLDFTRDNDGGINKDMPFMPPAMKTYDVFSSTAHNASSVFRADRNDYGVVRDPYIVFPNTAQTNKMHMLDIMGLFSFNCIGVSVEYQNVKTQTEGTVIAGGCLVDLVPFRNKAGKEQNLFFKPCGAISQADDSFFNQVNKYSRHRFDPKLHTKGSSAIKRPVVSEPIAIYTNSRINELPQTVISKQLVSYDPNTFPANKSSITTLINRPSTNKVEQSKIGAIINTNKSGQSYVYGTPVENNIKNEVAFRVNGFRRDTSLERNGLVYFADSNTATQFNGEVRDYLYKNTITPSYATSYLLNAVLSPDYIDVSNDGITDDDLGNFVKFNYTKFENDYRWRVPYDDRDSNYSLLNRGVKVTKFDDMGSYIIGSKQTWYAHSIESKNYVVEFYLSKRDDALSSRSRIMRDNHPYAVGAYTDNKDSFATMQKLDSIKYYYKHDRYLTGSAAVPLKTIYFDYDYGISSNLPNSKDRLGKLRLLKVRVRHGNEPKQFAETYDFGYVNFNPSYNLGDKDGWGNYAPNTRPLPMCEFPYIDQVNRQSKDTIASAFHLNMINLPSGGKIEVEYEADEYLFVQNKRAMALTEVEGVGNSPNLNPVDIHGLYSNKLDPYLYIYVKAQAGLPTNPKSFLLNNSDLMYFNFNINIAGEEFDDFDQVKGYARVEDINRCPNNSGYLYIKVKPVDLTGAKVSPSPMTNTAINMARAFASDQLYFQEREHGDGHNRNKIGRLLKAANQVNDAILGKNSIKELMKDFRAGHRFIKGKSYVRLALTTPKIGGGSRVSKLTFDDEWNKTVSGEASSLIGYKYTYKLMNGTPSGVASYEPTVGGEENPLRSGSSYALSSNKSKYPPYDPIEMIKEDPVGESFYPTGSVGYGGVIIESIHKDYARSARSKLVEEFYTAKDFPFFSTFGPKSVIPIEDVNNFNPAIRDIMMSFLGIVKATSSSINSYEVKQDFVIETNDMHGKPKGTYNYRLLLKNGKEELVSSSRYLYHNNWGGRLRNNVDVVLYQGADASDCEQYASHMPKGNIVVHNRTLGVDMDVCTDSREVQTTEKRTMHKRGGGLKVCIPISIKPKFNWMENIHTHTDYFKSTTTTKIINRYGIMWKVIQYKEGAETEIENKYYDAVTGSPVVQVVKDKYGDETYSTNIPAYWTQTDLEPSYTDYPFYGDHAEAEMPDELTFASAGSNQGVLSGTGLIQASFTTNEDSYHPGDEIFVRSKSNIDNTLKWYRLYVVDVLVQKGHFSDPDPLSMRYGKEVTTGANYAVFVTQHEVNTSASPTLGAGDKLTDIARVLKYRSGRKNMLDLSAGNYQTYKNPFFITDSIILGVFMEFDTCKGPGFLKPAINATANRYGVANSIPDGSISNLLYNPVSIGILNQPYVSATYALYGDRKDPSSAMRQRGNGILPNWYYWLPARYDTNSNYVPRKALLTHWDDSFYNAKTAVNGNAVWFTASHVTKSIPSLGPVEETNPLGIYSSVFLEPATKKVMHATANAKYGQTWVETFEDLRQLKTYNLMTDLLFSPFQNYMATSTSVANGYKVFSKSQSLPTGNLVGSFTLDSTQAHTGLFSLSTTGSTTLKVTPRKYTGGLSYFFNIFDFNLDNTTNQKYTYEVWVKRSSGSISAPSVAYSSTTVALTPVSMPIDGWVLYRGTISASHGVQMTFTFPTSQSYDDIRVYPVASNVKSYVYHPFKTYLMAILDENNYATLYEYNDRNQLVRLKKETEKGVITITENIKNVITK
ncbi:MAG TPA: hypothetical protein VL098_08535 [Flavipsychrobacter sp.]|nr:hypothetical protein [Flavipsychrobacter sp.]